MNVIKTRIWNDRTHPLHSHIKRIGVLGKQAVRKKYLSEKQAGSVDEAWLRSILDDIDSNKVFCHVGLSDVNSAFEGNPYEFLRDLLHEYFDTVMAPAFTSSFIESKVYSQKYTKSDSGTFSNLLIDDAEYRTPDALRSIVVDGPFRFNDCEHRDSYGSNSAFAKLEKENVPVLNIGTPWLKCSQWHFLEQQYDVPYMKKPTFEGVQINEGGEAINISQKTGLFEGVWAHNRPKITRVLMKNEILRSHQRNSLNVMWHRLGDMRRCLGSKLRLNPYYLVT
ncbi:AAC(3) family N-acetyltransferase [Natrialbaceae archaeon A-CW1-1]